MTRRHLLLAPFALAGTSIFAREMVQKFDAVHLRALDAAVKAAVDKREIPGAVVWIERRSAFYTKAYGSRQIDPSREPMTEETMFDIASLTKVVATTPAIMKLIEMGRLDLNSPVSAYIKEFTGNGRDAITLRNLLTHTSGLPPGMERQSGWSGYEAGIAKVCALPLKDVPGTKFVYSDLNFILLGEIVRRVSGERLDAFLRNDIFNPLGMKSTMFLPPKKLKDTIAPTTREGGVVIRGVVHDPTSRLMGGVTGHAGCFSTVSDLAKYARFLLLRSSSKSVLKPATVRLMTSVQSPPGIAAKRGLGWDIDSSFSDLRGPYVQAGSSFGHTGWTGTSIWIDPASDSFVILLTNRNHPTEAGKTHDLRIAVATEAGLAMGLDQK